MDDDIGMDDDLTQMELVIIEAAATYRKQLASRIKDPTSRLAALAAITLYEKRLRAQILADRHRTRSSNKNLKNKNQDLD